MKFCTVNIRKSSTTGKFEVSFYNLDGDRQPTTTKPNNWGFYYFPEKVGTRTGFNLLVTYMIDMRLKEIERLKNEIRELQDLEYKEP